MNGDMFENFIDLLRGVAETWHNEYYRYNQGGSVEILDELLQEMENFRESILNLVKLLQLSPNYCS